MSWLSERDVAGRNTVDVIRLAYEILRRPAVRAAWLEAARAAAVALKCAHTALSETQAAWAEDA